MSSSQFRRGKRRFDDDESTFVKRDRHRRRLPPADFGPEAEVHPEQWELPESMMPQHGPNGSDKDRVFEGRAAPPLRNKTPEVIDEGRQQADSSHRRNTGH